MKPRSAKAKGRKLEKLTHKDFQSFGWKSFVVPGSGAFDGWPGDVSVISPGGGKYLVECKSWKHGWRTGDNAMGHARFLVIKRDHGEPMVYMSLATFGEVVAPLAEVEK